MPLAETMKAPSLIPTCRAIWRRIHSKEVGMPWDEPLDSMAPTQYILPTLPIQVNMNMNQNIISAVTAHAHHYTFFVLRESTQLESRPPHGTTYEQLLGVPKVPRGDI